VHGRQGGAFAITADAGPMPGIHEAQIRWISQQSSYDASGKYSIEHSLTCIRSVEIMPNQPLNIRLQPEDFSPSESISEGTGS